MSNDKNEMKRCGRGIATAVVITILLGTLLPLTGNTAQASAMETSETTTEGATNPEPAWGQTLVYGTVKYKDRDTTGNETPDSPLPLRFAKVELFQYYWPSGGEICLKTDYTSETGYFRFEFDPYPTDSDNQYFVRVYSENKYAEVKDCGVYTHDSDIITIPAGGSGLQYPIEFSSYPDHQAWNILDSVTEAAEWVKARVGRERPKIDVYFPRQVDYPHYNPDDSIELTSMTSNVGWWDNIIYHEYSHAIMAYLYDWDYPASDPNHAFTKETTFECVISEGWAEFLANAVGGGSIGAWDSSLSKSIGDVEYGEAGILIPSPYSPSYRDSLPFGDTFENVDSNANGIIDYDMIEGNFAGILWDIFDNEYSHDRFFTIDWGGNTYNSYDDDGLSLGFEPIWDVMVNKNPFTIYKFWDGWFQYSGHASTAHDKHWIKAIYFNHGIDTASSNIASAYRLPQNAPAPNLCMDIIPSGGAYGGIMTLYATHVWDQDSEDQDFLRCRFEYYADENGNGIAADGGGWITINGSEYTSSSYDRVFDWDTTAVPEGQYLLRAVVDDDMLETYMNYSDNPIIIDHTLPVSSATHSSAYWRNTSPISISATASDINGVKAVTFRYRYSADNASWGPWTNYATDTAAPWEWSFNCPSGRGYYEFHTIATDNAGNLEAAKTAAEAAYFYIYPPSGKIYINADTPQTQLRSVNIDLSHITSGATLDKMRFANENTYEKQWHNQYLTIQSPHPVYPGDRMSFYLSHPDTNRMSVHFERIELRENADFIYIKNSQGNVLASFTGSYPSGIGWTSSETDNVNWIEVEMVIHSANSCSGYGFKIDWHGYYMPQWSSWEAFSASRAWTLSPGYGEKTVYCQITDVGGE